ncbi:MAG: P-II family nitrogen regulator [Clostridia bacterium]|nr:P-II family nitrogen regulator [Clostridia bacterium]
MQNIRLFLTVTRRDDTERYTKFFARQGVPVIYTLPANGTASAKTLDLFGLEQTEKSMICAVVTAQRSAALVTALTEEMLIDLPDQGIAIAIPLSSMGGQTALSHFFPGELPADDRHEEKKKMNESNHELIIAISERGQIDLVMDAARAGGARGGTVIHAKGTAGAGAQTFFGVSIVEEKEMIFIVSDAESKREIMRSIMQKAGADTDARAVVFSLPVTEACGFRYGK